MPEKKSSKKVLFGVLGGVVVVLLVAVGFLLFQVMQRDDYLGEARESYNRVAEAYAKFEQASSLSEDEEVSDQTFATIRGAREEIVANLAALEESPAIQRDAEAMVLLVDVQNNLSELNAAGGSLEEGFGDVVPMISLFSEALDGDEINTDKISVLLDVLDGLKTMRYPVNSAYLRTFVGFVGRVEEIAEVIEICDATPRQCDTDALEAFDEEALANAFDGATEKYLADLRRVSTPNFGSSLSALGDYLEGKKVLW